MVQTLAPQIPYWPSSPSSGGALDSPNDENRGDVHDWDVWHGEKPFFAYRNHLYRYVSEFGFQAFPCRATIEAFTLPNDRNIFSPVMERHQRNKSANGKILAYLAQNYRLPENFSDLLYLSQLLQADAVRCGVEHWRSHRGRCMGAIYWQLNDCWPVASWSSIDYYGRWKALHYAARRFFAPVMLCCREEGEHTQRPQINDFSEASIRCSASLTLCNETRTPVSGRVLWALRTADGAAVKSGAFPAVVPALSVQSFPALDLNKINYRNCYLSYALIDKSNSVISQGTALFCAPKRFEFSNPHLSVRRAGNTLIVHADAYAQSVYIESEDPDLLLDDNFFSMNPGEQTVRILRGKATFPIVRSVYDCVYSRSV
ncbi:MAG: glycoside hydrolase family 2 protein [Christensenellales bacterium]